MKRIEPREGEMERLIQIYGWKEAKKLMAERLEKRRHIARILEGGGTLRQALTGDRKQGKGKGAQWMTLEVGPMEQAARMAGARLAIMGKRGDRKLIVGNCLSECGVNFSQEFDSMVDRELRKRSKKGQKVRK